MPETKAKKMTMPKKIGTCADKLYTVKQARLNAQKVVDELRAQETALSEHIIANLPKSDATGVAGRLARATIKTSDVPQVKDWPKFYAYIKKHNRFDLLQKRLASGAILDIQDDGKKVPGVQNYTAKKVSLNKI